MSEDAPTADGAPTADARAKVAGLVEARMKKLGYRISDIVRNSGLARNTLNEILNAEGAHEKSTWVALSAALEWHYQYLYQIICGEPAVESMLEAHYAKLVVGQTRLEDTVNKIDKKIDRILNHQRSLRNGP